MYFSEPYLICQTVFFQNVFSKLYFSKCTRLTHLLRFANFLSPPVPGASLPISGGLVGVADVVSISGAVSPAPPSVVETVLPGGGSESPE